MGPGDAIGAVAHPILRIENGRLQPAGSDQLGCEEPLELRIEGHSIAVLMRTPGHDRELAAGFLLTEGIIKSAKDIFEIALCQSPPPTGNRAEITLRRPEEFDPGKLSRHLLTSSSCGLCSKTTIDAALKRRRRWPQPLSVAAHTLCQLPARLRDAQPLFARTGGLHGCALFDTEGQLIAVHEDIGRHNALDKLIGQALLARHTPLHQRILMLSGRASFEMLQKAYAAGIPLIAAVGAPSSLAAQFATRSGQTLVGFLKNQSFNIYAGAQRVRPCA